MERALDPALLKLAFGEQESLPSAEEISERIAEAELALLLATPTEDAKLVDAGWYLHAVASSRYALQIYGLPRQRAAFKVAGHIFDLAAKAPNLQIAEKLKYCFASQVAYLRSELNPNALAIYNEELVGNLPELSLLTDFPNIALCCAVALLGFDVGYVFETTRQLQRQAEDLLARWALNDISVTPQGAAVGVASAARDLMTYLVYGRTDMLERAQDTLLTAIRSEASADDQVSRWIAAHLLNLIGDFANSSVWSVLPPDSPVSVKKAFAMGKPKVLTLWPPQIDLLKSREADSVSPLSHEVKRLFLSTPTSSGKTLLAQLLIASHISTRRTSVYYVAPTRSLCREVRVSLESRLRFVDTEVADGLPEGDWLRYLFLPGPRVEVMTPERLAYLLRSNSAQVLAETEMFIFDEVHNIGDQQRGVNLEEDLTFLHHATIGQEHRIVLISAAVGNQAHFVEWMEGGGNRVVLCDSDWRGPRRVHSICTTDVDWELPSVTPIRSTKYAHRIDYPIFGTLNIRMSQTGAVKTLRTTQAVGNISFKVKPNGQKEKDSTRSTPFYQAIIPIIKHLAKAGPVLIIESTRPAALRMAQALSNQPLAADSKELKALLDLVEARLGTQHPLREALRHGVAYHHGSLPSEIRAAIEDAVTSGNIKYLVATTTMTEGINLPVKSVVIASQGSYSAAGYSDYITGSKLINAMGRAGRATKETEGILVLALQERPNINDFDRLEPRSEDTNVVSMLASTTALEELAIFEDLSRSAEDAFLQVAGGPVSEFLSFVWFVTSQFETGGLQPVTFDEVASLLSHTLGWTQLDPEAKDRWLAVARSIYERYLATDETQRRRWASSGTSLSSAGKLETIAKSLADTLQNTALPEEPVEIIKLLLAEGRLEQILVLAETPKRVAYAQRAGKNRTVLAVPIEELLFDWIKGIELVELGDKYLQLVGDVSFRFEQLGDLLNEYFEIFFPWVFGTIIGWANEILANSVTAASIPNGLPAYVRWGVADPGALALMAKGMLSRTLATRISDKWKAVETDQDVFSWLRSLTMSDWRILFSATTTELTLLLDFCRNRTGGAAVEFLSVGNASIDVETELDNLPAQAAVLRAVDESQLSPLGVWVGGDLIGTIVSRDQSDVQAIMSSGLDN